MLFKSIKSLHIIGDSVKIHVMIEDSVKIYVMGRDDFHQRKATTCILIDICVCTMSVDGGKMLKAFIFDMDGVIIDSEPLHFQSDRMVMKDYNIDITDDELNSFVGVTNPEMWAALAEKYNMKATVEELLTIQNQYKTELFGKIELQPINGVLELLSELKEKGISIALASSSSRVFIELVLRGLHIYEYFDVIISGEEVTNGKPAPDIFLKAAAELKIDPFECVVLEDSSNGVKAAKAAGMKCIAYKNPNSGIQDISLADCAVSTLVKLDYLNI